MILKVWVSLKPNETTWINLKLSKLNGVTKFKINFFLNGRKNK